MPIIINNRFSSIIFSKRDFHWNRLNGPAYIYYDNYKEYWIDHKEYTEYQYYGKLKEMGYYDLHYKK